MIQDVPNAKILVVDDYEDNRDVMARRLERKGHEVILAEGGEKALEFMDSEGTSLDLVLLDIMMPDMDGMEVLSRIRQLRSQAELPVIMVTARDETEDIVQALKAGANDYVTKPFDFAILEARVNTHLQLTSTWHRLRTAQRSLVEAARLEAIGRLAAGVAHEVRNPLARVQMGVDALASGLFGKLEEGADELLQDISKAVRSADQIIQSLMQYSTDQREDFVPHSLNAVIHSALEKISVELEKLSVDLQLEEGLPDMPMNPMQMETALLNVLDNAIRVMPENGHLQIITRSRKLDEDEVVFEEGLRTGHALRAGDEIAELLIIDSGPGIPERVIDSVMDAFYTTRATGQGTGLGLTVSSRLVDMHGGSLRLRNREDEQSGVRVSFWLPVKRSLNTDV